MRDTALCRANYNFLCFLSRLFLSGVYFFEPRNSTNDF
nr:MAG TPA: hypothetical protein [Caudoviricetes sp.]